MCGRVGVWPGVVGLASEQDGWKIAVLLGLKLGSERGQRAISCAGIIMDHWIMAYGSWPWWGEWQLVGVQTVWPSDLQREIVLRSTGPFRG